MERPAENRIRNTATGRRGVPVKGELRPFRHHARASRGSNGKGDDEHDQAQNTLDRQLQRMPADENRAPTQQVVLVHAPQREKPSVKGKKCKSEKYGKDFPLKAQRPPENVSISQRPEPERVDVI